jgi:hypothetical protein
MLDYTSRRSSRGPATTDPIWIPSATHTAPARATTSTEPAGSGPAMVVRPGCLSAPKLGVALASWHVSGRSVRNELREPVVTAPMPSMPTGFRGGIDGSRYRSSYFDTDPGYGATETGYPHRRLRDDRSWPIRRHAELRPRANGQFGHFHAVETVSDVTASPVVGVKRLDGGGANDRCPPVPVRSAVAVRFYWHTDLVSTRRWSAHVDRRVTRLDSFKDI